MFGEGISGWSAYELGRSDAKTAAHNAKCMAGLRARLRGETILNPVALALDNEHLQQVIADKDRFISELSAYTDRLEASFNQYREWGDAAKRDSDRFQEWGRDNARDNARLREIIEGLERRLAVYEPP